MEMPTLSTVPNRDWTFYGTSCRSVLQRGLFFKNRLIFHEYSQHTCKYTTMYSFIADAKGLLTQHACFLTVNLCVRVCMHVCMLEHTFIQLVLVCVDTCAKCGFAARVAPAGFTISAKEHLLSVSKSPSYYSYYERWAITVLHRHR